jgi:hypothetical protein
MLAAVEDQGAPSALRRDAYFTNLFPLFGEIKGTADEILRMNQENMSEANDQARRTAAAARRHMYLLLAAGTAAALGLIFFSRTWVLRPILRLIRSTDEIRRNLAGRSRGLPGRDRAPVRIV